MTDNSEELRSAVLEALSLLATEDEGVYYCAICGVARSVDRGCKTKRVDPMPSCFIIEGLVINLILEKQRVSSDRPCAEGALTENGLAVESHLDSLAFLHPFTVRAIGNEIDQLRNSLEDTRTALALERGSRNFLASEIERMKDEDSRLVKGLDKELVMDRDRTWCEALLMALPDLGHVQAVLNEFIRRRNLEDTDGE